MRYITVILLVLLCRNTPVAAETTDQYLDFSAGYSRGDFDTGQTSELTQWQVTYGQVRERYDFSITVPYLFLSDSLGDESGLGDITLRAGMKISGNESAADSLYAAMAVKLPTADENKGLGSGETDVGGFLSYRRDFATTSLTLMGGYIITGDSAIQSYNDIYVYGIGVSRISLPWYVYGSLDGRQQTLDTGDNPLELSGGVFYQLQARRFLKIEGFVGLSNTSPDMGMTIGLVNWF